MYRFDADMILSYVASIMALAGIAASPVRARRQARDWSQAELARRGGIGMKFFAHEAGLNFFRVRPETLDPRR